MNVLKITPSKSFRLIKYPTISRNLIQHNKVNHHASSLIRQQIAQASTQSTTTNFNFSKALLITTGLLLSTYALYHLAFPNISLFPPDARDLLRKALWAKNRHNDYPTAIEYYNQAIEAMKNNPEVNQSSSYYIGTLLELAHVCELNSQFKEANKQYYNAIELLAPKSIYHKAKDIGLSSALSPKIKLKVIGIFQKLAHNYGELASQNPRDKEEYLATQEQYLSWSLETILANNLTNSIVYDLPPENGSSGLDPQTSLPYNYPVPKYPRWIPKEEIACCFERLADFYRLNNQVRLALPLYYSAIMLDPSHEISAQLWCNLGSCQFKLKLYDTSKISFVKGIEKLEQNGYYTAEGYHTMAVLKHNLGHVYEKMHDTPSAIQIYGEILNHKKLQESLDIKTIKGIQDHLEKLIDEDRIQPSLQH